MWFTAFSMIYDKDDTPDFAEPCESKVFAENELEARQKLLRAFHAGGKFARFITIDPVPLMA